MPEILAPGHRFFALKDERRVRYAIFTSALMLIASCQKDATEPGVIPPPPPPIVIVADSVPDAIVLENSLPGTDRWHEYGSHPALPVYATPYAPRRGDTLYVHASSSNAGEGSIEIYRLGWYGGAGGRLIKGPIAVEMRSQPACTQSSPPPAECPWAGEPVMVVDSAWLAGIYMLRATGPDGEVGFYPFVVSSTRQRSALAVIPQFTWQAYNAYAGASLYSIDPITGKNSVKDSFERPYDADRGLNRSFGSYSGFGFKAIRFLEREGYDIGYISDLDLTDSTRLIAGGFKALLFVGHSEYWTWAERLRIEGFRDIGKHLAFFGSNNSYWAVRLQPSGITGSPQMRLVCFRYPPDPEAISPEQTTTLFRTKPLSRPENQIVGEMYMGLLTPGTAKPFVVAADSLHGPEARGFLAQADLKPGDTLSIDVGTEVDQVVENGVSPAGLQTLLTNTVPDRGSTRTYQATFYRASSGAGVFATGTNHWEQYLDGTVDPRVQELTRAALNWMLTH